ncbi:MAG: DMT family transporter [Pseudobdellovibrio sp.]|nr:DMT family transporter [Pseudobdellovibrio sp.]
MRKALAAIPVYHRAVLELFIAGMLWGISFTFVKWALVDFSPTTLVFWRFAFAIVLAEVMFFIFDREGFKKSHRDYKIGLFAGIGLGSSLIFQTIGLQTTTATNSSFITSLYVVLIPFANYFFLKTKVHWYHFALSFVAFLGMGLLLDLPNNGLKLQSGDLFTILVAVTSTFHIIAVGIGSKRMQSGFRFNTSQTFWAWIFLIPFLAYDMSAKDIPFFPPITSYMSVFSVIGLAILVTLGAFYLQVRAQRVLSTTTASMLCLLEAPYSFLFASALLNEKLTPIQLAGAILILGISALTIYVERPKNTDS